VRVRASLPGRCAWSRARLDHEHDLQM